MKLPVETIKPRNFEEDLGWSELPEQWITYLRAVLYWWPDTTNWERVTDLARQRKQRDIGLELASGATLRLQVKRRRKDYGDMCIEYLHQHETGRVRPGWINELAECDYLLYCVPGKVYRMSYPELQAAWRKNQDSWIALYDSPGSENDGHGDPYLTRFVSVPWGVLQGAGVNIEIAEF